jgi:hypothetical protein
MMDPRTNDGSTLREFRRYQLALRLMAHQVRTQTISAMTSLTKDQLATLRRRWRVAEQTRHRGPSPSSLERFTHSPRARSEGAALVAFCRIHGALLPPIPSGNATLSFLTLEFGERLSLTYEAYRACFPRCELEIEELLCLTIGLAENKVIGLSLCSSCGGTVLIDRLAPHRHSCAHCQRTEVEAVR